MTVLNLVLVLVLIVAGGVFAFFWIKKRRKKFLEQLKETLFVLEFPSVSRQEKEKVELAKEMAKMEQFLSDLTFFKKPITLEAAIPHVGEEIKFYAAVPSSLAVQFKKHVQSVWSEVIIEEAAEYNIFNNVGATVGAFAAQKKSYVYPLRTYQEANVNTFQAVLGGLAKLRETGEGGAIQLIIQPARRSLIKNIKKTLERLRKGEKLEEDSFTKGLGKEFQKALIGSGKEENGSNQPPVKPVDDALIKEIQSKISKPILEVNLRIFASADTQSRAQHLLDGIIAGLSQFGTENNELKITVPKKINDLAYKFSFRLFDDKNKMILNTEELASLFHFPNPTLDVPGIKTLKYRQLPPPPDLPNSGLLIGKSVYRGREENVFLTEDDRRRHLYVIGQTGTGKTNLILNMAIQDVKDGKGLAIIDPHGDLVQDVLNSIPQKRYEDVIYFDPGSLQRPLGLNMLEYNFDRPEEKTFIVNELWLIFDRLYDMKTTGGPMFEQYMRNALLLLMEDAPNEPATLMEVLRVFTDEDYRNRKLSRINNPIVVDFWQKQAAKATGDVGLQNIAPYVTSKFNNFTANDYMRPIIGQVKSAFSFREAMDEGKILLINLSKGKIGDLNANLLGMIIVGRLLMAALSRVDIKDQARRRDFYLYIDEFQNFTTDSISTILSEARKYRLNLTIAHQYIDQLEEKIKDSVFGNVGSKVVMRVSAKDAEYLVKEFAPYVDPEDLINIDNFNAYVRLLINGGVTPPFNIRALKAPIGDPEVGEKLAQLSFLKYGRPREEVELEIRNRLRS